MLEQKWVYSLSELEKIAGNEEFIIYMYAVLLGRIADKSGYIEYLSKLNGGRLSKGELIVELLDSKEAREHGILVTGLGLAKVRLFVRKLTKRSANMILKVLTFGYKKSDV